MTRIFINYRREDCPAHAGRLADTLEARFGKGSVFMDVATIDFGVARGAEQAAGGRARARTQPAVGRPRLPAGWKSARRPPARAR